MERFDLYIMGTDVKRCVDALHEARIVQSAEVASSGEKALSQEMLALKARLERLMDFLLPFEHRKEGFMGLTGPEPKVYKVPSGDIVPALRRWLSSAESAVLPLQKERSKLLEDLSYVEEASERLRQLSGLDLDIMTLSILRRARVRVGFTRRYQELEEAIVKVGGSIEGSLLDRKEGLHAVRVAYLQGSETRIEEFLRGRLFSELPMDWKKLIAFLRSHGMKDGEISRPIEKLLPLLDSVQISIQGTIDARSKEGTELAARYLDRARSWLEAAEISLEKEAYASSFQRTRYTCRIGGWVESDRVGELEGLLKGMCEDSFHLEHRPPTKEEEGSDSVPTKLKNGWMGRLFEPFTLTFAIPKYNEIDPSLLISMPFIFIFGLMMGDAGYGLLMLIGGFILLIKARRSDFLKRTGIISIFFGMASIIAGIWMGGFFGDLVPRIIWGDPSRYLYSVDLFGYHLPYDSLKDPMFFFLLSLLIGLVQLDFGILLLGYDRLKKRNYLGVLKGAVSWVFVQGGAGIFIGSFLGGLWELTGTLAIIGGVMLLIGCVLLFLEAGPMFIFSIEGYVGDLMSYSRILALGLSSFGLAFAFNVIVELLMGISPFLVPVGIVLLVSLHVLNLFLQILGGAIHSLRLQYVEFFGKFYEGGGNLFKPFGRIRTTTLLAEDKVSAIETKGGYR